MHGVIKLPRRAVPPYGIAGGAPSKSIPADTNPRRQPKDPPPSLPCADLHRTCLPTLPPLCHRATDFMRPQPPSHHRPPSLPPATAPCHAHHLPGLRGRRTPPGTAPPVPLLPQSPQPPALYTQPAAPHPSHPCRNTQRAAHGPASARPRLFSPPFVSAAPHVAARPSPTYRRPSPRRRARPGAAGSRDSSRPPGARRRRLGAPPPLCLESSWGPWEGRRPRGGP
jgi:hypothetical protein